ncbi:MAG: hypothetical protein M3251_05310, partial [Thermoproteota archaeon]|nr:hypothetical protein [Thermoproteota archaeon]
MSQTADSNEANVNVDHDKQKSVELSSMSRFFDKKTIHESGGVSPGKGRTSYLGYCRSSLWFILSLLHSRIIEFVIRIAASNPIAFPKRARIVSFGVPFLFIILLVNLPIVAAGQEDADD